MSFFSLPPQLICEVLGQWIALKFVARLDTACCVKSSRSVLLGVLASPELTHHTLLGLSERVAEWLLKKKLKVSHVAFGADASVNQVEGCPIETYLLKYGLALINVHFCRCQDSHLYYLTAIYCRNIHVIKFTAISPNKAIREVFAKNQKIHTLELTGIDWPLSFKVLHGSLLSNLTTFSLTDSSSCSVVYCDKLEVIKVSRCSFTNRDWNTHPIVRFCKNLRSVCLSKNGFNMSSPTSVTSPHKHIFRQATLLVNIDLYRSDVVRDNDILFLAQCCINMRAVNIQSCSKLTNMATEHLVRERGSRLHILYVQMYNLKWLETTALATFIGESCTSLEYLDIQCSHKCLCTNGATFSLVHGCPALRTLAVDNVDVICLTSRRFINVLRLTLQVVVHERKFDVVTMST